MGLFDFIFGNGSNTAAQPAQTQPAQAAPAQPQSGDPVGNYLGNLIDPGTAQQFAAARAQQGLLGLSMGLLQGSGPSRLPVPFGSALGAGLQGMLSSQKDLSTEALQAANTQNTITDAQYKKLQGMGLLQNMGFLQQQADAVKQAYGQSPANPPQVNLQNGAFNTSGDLSSYADKVISAESGGKDQKNPRSSATGPGQFTDDTWLDLARKTMPATAQLGDDALLSLRHESVAAKTMTQAYGAQNAQTLASAGIPVTDANLYAAHFLGPGGAMKVLTASDDTPLATLLSPAAITANPFLKGKTVADFNAYTRSKMGGSNAVQIPPALLAGNGGNAPPGLLNIPGGSVNQGNAMPRPPGVTDQQINAARMANAYATMRGATPDPYLAKIGNYGPEAALAAANANSEQGARANWAGVHSYNEAAGAAPFNMTQEVTVPDGQGGIRKIKVPLNTYLGILQQQGLGGGSPAMPTQVPPMPGSNLSPGGVLGTGQAAPAPLPAPPPMPAPTGLVPGGAMPPQRAAGSVPQGPNGFVGGSTPPAASPAQSGPAAAPMGQPTGPMLGTPELDPKAAFNPYAYRFMPKVGQGPGQTEPITVPPTGNLPMQTVIPPLSQAPPIQGSQKDIENNSALGKTTLESWNKAQAAAPNAIQRVEAISNVMKYYQTGAWSEHISDILADLKAAGISVSASNAHDPAKMQEILKNNFGAALATMQATGLARWTQAELLASQKNFANPGLQPAANFEIVAQNLGNLYQTQAMIRDWRNAQLHGWTDPNAFEQAWLNHSNNGLERFIDAAKVKIGPFAGMQQGEIAQTMPRVIQNPKSGQTMMQSGGQWIPIGASR